MIKATYSRQDDDHASRIVVHGFKDDREAIQYFSRVSPVRFFGTEFREDGFIMNRTVTLYDGTKVELSEDTLWADVREALRSVVWMQVDKSLIEGVSVYIFQHPSTITFEIDCTFRDANVAGIKVVELSLRLASALDNTAVLGGITAKTRSTANIERNKTQTLLRIQGELIWTGGNS